jgi:hypothetical protein
MPLLDVENTSPAVQALDADGFFVMTGTVSEPEVYDYTLVQVVKDGTGESTTFRVRGSFIQGTWLRFGPTVSGPKLYQATQEERMPGTTSCWVTPGVFWMPPGTIHMKKATTGYP